MNSAASNNNHSNNKSTTQLAELLNEYQLDIGEFQAVTNELINMRLKPLCKQYCFNNRYQFQCTIEANWGINDVSSPLCEWGNASYAWFLDELCNPNRLEKIHGGDKSSITKYFSKIIHSIAFIERFKNWRFQRRIRVPEYIKAIDIDAHRVFWGLCDQDSAQNIAQRLGRSETDTLHIITRINEELVKRKKTHLLNLIELLSFSSLNKEDDHKELEIKHEDVSIEHQQYLTLVKQAYGQLDWLEQFIIDSMIIDGLSAKSVLASLKKQNISVDERVDAEQQNIQHVYYFLRKTIAKLKESTSISDTADIE